MESGNPDAVPAAAPICTCGPDLLRNGGYVHNYACPMTPKCMHLIPRINLQTGETEERPCGSRLEPHFENHCYGCPRVALCPHCGTLMDRRGIHNIGCPNRPSYSFENLGNSRRIVRFSEGFEQPDRPNFQSFTRRLLDMIWEMPVIPVSPPSIIPGDFEIKGECSICRDECEQSQRVLKPSGCNHCFHETCLMTWINFHPTCPNCRGETQTILRKN